MRHKIDIRQSIIVNGKHVTEYFILALNAETKSYKISER